MGAYQNPHEAKCAQGHDKRAIFEFTSKHTCLIFGHALLLFIRGWAWLGWLRLLLRGLRAVVFWTAHSFPLLLVRPAMDCIIIWVISVHRISFVPFIKKLKSYVKRDRYVYNLFDFMVLVRGYGENFRE
jgi:hypothetical protein